MNRFMKKFKAVYCNASFIFAIAVLMVTISLCIFYPDRVNASQSPSPSGDISTNDVTNDLDDVKSLDSEMQFRKDGVNMGLPMLSEYEIWRTDVDNIRAAKKVLEEL